MEPQNQPLFQRRFRTWKPSFSGAIRSTFGFRFLHVLPGKSNPNSYTVGVLGWGTRRRPPSTVFIQLNPPILSWEFGVTLPKTNCLPMKIPSFLVNTITMVDFPASYVSFRECTPPNSNSNEIRISWTLRKSHLNVYAQMLGSIFANSSSDQKSSRMLRNEGTNGIDLKNEEFLFHSFGTENHNKRNLWTLSTLWFWGFCGSKTLLIQQENTSSVAP